MATQKITIRQMENMGRGSNTQTVFERDGEIMGQIVFMLRPGDSEDDMLTGLSTALEGEYEIEVPDPAEGVE